MEMNEVVSEALKLEIARRYPAQEYPALKEYRWRVSKGSTSTCMYSAVVTFYGVGENNKYWECDALFEYLTSPNGYYWYMARDWAD
ncbi:hypothetical protein ACSZNT_02130 [Aeromonas veronii]